MEIRDLGTQFCVSAYNNDANSHVVLVKGKVEIETKGKRKNTLSPISCSCMSTRKTKESVHQVNTQDYVAWKDGYYQCNAPEVRHCTEKLCKYYGIKIHWDEKVGGTHLQRKAGSERESGESTQCSSERAPIKVEQ